MSRIPVFVEKSPRKNWDKGGETCIFIARRSVTTSSEVEDDLDRGTQSEMVKNSSMSVVSCVKGVVNSSCYCLECKELASITTKFKKADGGRKSFIPIKEGGLKTFGWNGPKLTPAKSILTPAPVNKTRSRLKTKSSKTNKEEHSGSSKICISSLTPAKSLMSPTRASKSAFKSVLKTAKLQEHALKQCAPSSCDASGVNRSDSKSLTSFEYEDSEPECFQHEVRNRLASDSPASVKGLNKENSKFTTTKVKQNCSRVDNECPKNAFRTEIENDGHLTIQNFVNEGKNSVVAKLDLCCSEKTHSQSTIYSEIKNCDNVSCDSPGADVLDTKDDYYKGINRITDELESAQHVQEDVSDDVDQIMTPPHKNLANTCSLLEPQAKSFQNHIDNATELLAKQKITSGEIDKSGHVTCVISSPPSGRLTKAQARIPPRSDHGPGTESGCSAKKLSKLPVYSKRALPKTPSEIRTVKYGQKIVQENKDCVKEITEKSEPNKIHVDKNNKSKHFSKNTFIKTVRDVTAEKGLYKS